MGFDGDSVNPSVSYGADQLIVLGTRVVVKNTGLRMWSVYLENRIEKVHLVNISISS